MRVSRLSELTGVPVPTIKFYLRDGLLPKGTATARNQATYTEEHVDRLNLIRTLTTIGRLPLDTVREVVRSVDAQFVARALKVVADSSPSVDDVLATAPLVGFGFPAGLVEKYRRAAQQLETADLDVCADTDAATIVAMSLLGDALIVAMRSQVRTETPA